MSPSTVGAIVINPMINWALWIGQPLWKLALAQVVLITAFIWLGNRLVLEELRREIAVIEQQIGEQSRGIRNIQQQLTTMPALAEMQTQLTAWTKDKTPFLVDKAAQWVTEPLSQSGALLLSWQPVQQNTPATAEDSAWNLSFNADYPGLINVVRHVISLPYVLRLEQLMVKSTAQVSNADRRLRVEMIVMRPTVGRSQSVE
ncbi:hypothetical protein [Brenneria izbisi]|uniref:Uncharacterized protein n=1 Tax=Brenneria izbisi TaxID=2939450 RepID=A0AA42C2L5_9GAMM|nr:hypothetical protein [Brenneria izbisi]MCV9879443.1 hypothetical protein [Brenneria izbisi]MCV9882643.1 hypothetical protein [Brenneria izbisi]